MLAERAGPAEDAGRSTRRPGWDALECGTAQEAAAAFEEALRGAPREPTGTARRRRRGAPARATGRPRGAISSKRSSTTPTLTRGVAAARRGAVSRQRHGGAIDVYEHALAHAPGHQLAERRSWRRGARKPRFTTGSGRSSATTSPSSSKAPPKRSSRRRRSTILEAAYWRIGSALYTYPSDVIVVVLYTREQFTDVTQFAEVGRGGLRRPDPRTGAGSAAEPPRVRARARARVHPRAGPNRSRARGVPVWLNEGLAMMFDGTRRSKRRRRSCAAAERSFRCRRLEGSFERLDTAAATVAYAQRRRRPAC